MYSKTFYDLACGGAKKAKAKAIAWRDGQLAKLKALSLAEFHEHKRSNNLSGVAGVHFHKSPRQPLGFWQAKIRLHDGTRKAKSFSVQKFGDKDAFRLAVAARSELLAMVENRPFLHSPVAKLLSR